MVIDLVGGAAVVEVGEEAMGRALNVSAVFVEGEPWQSARRGKRGGVVAFLVGGNMPDTPHKLVVVSRFSGE